MTAASDPAYFMLTFAPSLALVSTVRRFVSEFYQEVLDDADASSRVGLATHELLENAVKYCLDQETTLRVSITPGPEGCVVNIRTNNRASAERITHVQNLIARGKDADPKAHYQRVLRESVAKVDESGLGLARIVAETGMDLTCEIMRDRIEVQARGQFGTLRDTSG